MKRFYWVAGGALVLAVVIVLFVPGVRELIEGTLLGWLASAAR